MKEGEQAVRLDLRNLAEFALQPLGTLQSGLTQGVRCLEHDERLLAFRKHPLEFEGRLCHGIAGHDETLDRRIRGYPRDAVNAGRREHQVEAGDPVPGVQYVQKEPEQFGRDDDTHELRRPLAEPVGHQRPGMIAYRDEHTTDGSGGNLGVLRPRVSGRSRGRAALHRSIRESGGHGRSLAGGKPRRRV